MNTLKYVKVEATNKLRSVDANNYDVKLEKFLIDIKNNSDFENFDELYFGTNEINESYFYYYSIWPSTEFEKFIKFHQDLNFACSYNDLGEKLDESIFKNSDFKNVYKESVKFRNLVAEFL
ncbi:hypothetical protein [Psychroflexus planctonicus]|nr:hypothetical protein [Psychroflexus planctonicus]